MLKTVDIVIIVVYFSVMFILGIVAWRKNKTTEDYFVAGKTLGTFSLASMWLSSWIGGASIIGTATDAFDVGISGGWYVTFLACGCVIFGLTFTQLVKRLGDKLHDITYPGLITSRYDKKSGAVVVVSCFLANVGFLSSQLVAMGTMLTTITGWDSWTCFVVSTVITIAYSALGVLCIAIGATYMGLAAKVLMPDMADGGSAYAAIVVNYFPAGISGLVLVGVFAAIMSTGVVCINSCAANISVDIYRDRINPKASDRKVSMMGIVSSLAVGVVGAALAWWKYDIVDLLLLALTFQAASLFFPTVFGMFWKRATKRASFVSMCVSLAAVFIWLLGDGLGWGPIFEIDALWPGLISSGVVFFAVALLTKPTPDDMEKAEVFCSVRRDGGADGQ